MARRIDLHAQVDCLDFAARAEADLFGMELEIEFFQDPIFVGFHFQTGGGGLDGAEQVQVQ